MVLPGDAEHSTEAAQSLAFVLGVWACLVFESGRSALYTNPGWVERGDLTVSNLGLMVACGHRPAQQKYHVVLGDKRGRIWAQIFGKRKMSRKDFLWPFTERDAN